MRVVGARIITPEGWIDDGYMDIGEDGRIKAIGIDWRNLESSTDQSVMEVHGAIAIPGLIDVHVHGGGGFDVMAGELEHLAGMSRYHASHGTTSFLATTVTASKADIVHALKGIAKAIGENLGGADLLGAHLEGPFLNQARCGAQNPANLRNPSLSEWVQFVEAADGHIRLLTIAPELPEAEAVVRDAIERNCTVSIGHSNADYEGVSRAIAWGCSHVTHMFNGMSPLHHRDPGVAGGALLRDELSVELIADGVHVHPDLIRGVFRAKPRDRVVLVTDCIPAGGCTDGDYILGGLPVRMENGRIYVSNSDGSKGSLAGSSLTTIEALRNAVEFTGKPMEEVLVAATLNPARQIGVEERKGSLEVGKDADFIILDTNWQLKQTFVRGQLVYDSSNLA